MRWVGTSVRRYGRRQGRQSDLASGATEAGSAAFLFGEGSDIMNDVVVFLALYVTASILLACVLGRMVSWGIACLDNKTGRRQA